MEDTPTLKNGTLLPRKATKLAMILSNYDEGATKKEVKKVIKTDDYLNAEDMDEAVRMLYMTDNIEICQNKAYLVEHNFQCKGIRKNPFREWERKAIKENADTLNSIKKEQRSKK